MGTSRASGGEEHVEVRGRTLVAAACVAVMAACNSESGADPTTSTRSTTADTEASDPSTTTSSSTTTTSTTTTLPPTTTSPEQVKQEVAAAFVQLEAQVFEMLQTPSLDGLDARVANVAVRGSQYYETLTNRMTELVTSGQFVGPNTPDVRSLTVESVELVGSPPYADANVTVCQVSNALVIRNADNPVMPGTTIPVGGTGELAAYRYTQNLVLTEDGWRHDRIADPSDPYWPGLSECPAD